MLCTIMTLNLRVDLPQDGDQSWNNRSQSVAHLFQQYRPAVAATQEGKLHMLNDLQDRLEAYSWIGTDRYAGTNDEFCSIFYRNDVLTCLESGQFWLSEEPDKAGSTSWNSDFPRFCTWARFQFRQESEQEFIVYNTHLDHISQQARERGMELILGQITQDQAKLKLSVILTGDFNATPDNPVLHLLNRQSSATPLRLLENAYRSMATAPGKTFHGFAGGNAGEPIDYIFCSGEIIIQETFIDRSEPSGVYQSDHYPVITRLDI